MKNPGRAEHAATQLVATGGVKGPPVDVETLAAGQGVRLEYKALEENVSGCLVHSQDGVLMMAVNRAHHPNRQRFTIAHELGHLLLHASEPSLFVDDMMVHFRVKDRIDPKEVEANAFAAALLMPASFLRADLETPLDPFDEDGVLQLARRYGVSQQALTIRLVGLGLVDGVAGGATAVRAKAK